MGKTVFILNQGPDPLKCQWTRWRFALVLFGSPYASGTLTKIRVSRHIRGIFYYVVLPQSDYFLLCHSLYSSTKLDVSLVSNCFQVLSFKQLKIDFHISHSLDGYGVFIVRVFEKIGHCLTKPSCFQSMIQLKFPKYYQVLLLAILMILDGELLPVWTPFLEIISIK